MAFCENCGAQLSGSGKFCSECGKPVGKTESASSSSPESKGSRRLSKALLGILALAILLAGVGVAAAYYVIHRGTAKTAAIPPAIFSRATTESRSSGCLPGSASTPSGRKATCTCIRFIVSIQSPIMRCQVGRVAKFCA